MAADFKAHADRRCPTHAVVPGLQGPRRDFRISVGLLAGDAQRAECSTFPEAVPTARAGGRLTKNYWSRSSHVPAIMRPNKAASELKRGHERSEPTGSANWAGALAGAPLAICAGLVESAGHRPDDLVQATCLRAIERADQFVPGTQVDRWLFAILRSIWLNEIRSSAAGIREGGGFVDAADALTTDGASEIEMNITAPRCAEPLTASRRRSARRMPCWSMAKGTVTPRRRPCWASRSARL